MVSYLLREEYGKVTLRKRPTHPLMMKGKSIRNNKVKTKLTLASLKKSQPFRINDLEVALKGIK